MFNVDIYIETSMKGPGRRKGWYAAVIECKKRNGEIHKRTDYVEEENLTYHKSVLRGLIRSLQRLNTCSSICIHTDSMYLIGNVKRGNLDKWRENDFTSSKNREIKNRSEWEMVDKLLKGHKIEFCYGKQNKYTEELQQFAEKIKQQVNVGDGYEH